MRKWQRLAAIFGLIGSAAAAPAVPWKSIYPPLSDKDITLIQSAARIEMEGKPEGTTLEWANPKSGAKGSVTLLKRFYVDGQECRRLRHVFEIERTEPWHYRVTICHQVDGSWRWQHE